MEWAKEGCVMPCPALLFIDDQPQLLRLRKTTLEKLGYSVTTAASTTAAIKALEESPVSAVLMDYKSEGLDAEAVAFHIKQRFPQQAIILMSAYSDMPERVLWLVDEYVMRSTSLDGLAQVIERVIQERQPGAALETRAAAA